MQPTSQPDRAPLELLASGRRIANLCMFAWLAAATFHVIQTPLAVLFFLGSTIAAIVGTLLVTEGLDLSGSKRLLLVVGATVPIIGLLVMGWLSFRAASTLRSAGYHVGMFQSSKRRVA
jgi:hypothetical protein